MNEIKVKISFKKGTCNLIPMNCITGDYNSTKLVFEFDRQDGTKIFEMKNPDDEVVLATEIINNEVILASLTEEGEYASIFTMAGDYRFEVSLYTGNDKLTSKDGKIKVKEEQVIIGDKIATPFLPVFDEMVNQLQEALNQTNNIDIDINDSVVTITKKDGTSKSENVKGADGHTPQKGLDYWTEADKKEIVDEVIELLPTYNGEVL